MPAYLRDDPYALMDPSRRHAAWIRDEDNPQIDYRSELPVNAAHLPGWSRLYAPRFWVSVRRRCEKCGREYSFTAREQKFWYERLGFPLGSRPKHCLACRRALRAVKRSGERYSAAMSKLPRDATPGGITAISDSDLIELAEAMIALLAIRQLSNLSHQARVKNLLRRRSQSPRDDFARLAVEIESAMARSAEKKQGQ